jgi:hypothetical protein
MILVKTQHAAGPRSLSDERTQQMHCYHFFSFSSLLTFGSFSYSAIYLLVFRSVSGISVRDHIYYLGVSMHAEDWSSCRIVMDYSKLQYQMDLNGNVILSKQPGLSNDRGFTAQ